MKYTITKITTPPSEPCAVVEETELNSTILAMQGLQGTSAEVPLGQLSSLRAVVFSVGDDKYVASKVQESDISQISTN